MLNKKKIIITGNTSGIGLELNKLLIRNNHIIGISKSNSNIQNNLQVKVNLNNLNILKKKNFWNKNTKKNRLFNFKCRNFRKNR